MSKSCCLSPLGPFRVSRECFSSLDCNLHKILDRRCWTAITKVPADATSYAYHDPRKHPFLYQFSDGTLGGDYPATGFTLLEDWVKTFTDGLNAAQWGMYINYADPLLNRTEAQDVYYRQNLPRLKQIKRDLDPKEVFYYPLAVEPAKA